ncbi:VOC family protein [Trabulsiella odontotermitis]|uniref:VOC family protein n=1 Tax=Trabulsiella odontotermitis TaxID=379893 RepID=UPI0024B858BE|nr:VOC family protein [Trabulsiella odontotermitis]WHP31893.1 VOC family protein [Trabulsiella odontotermitis]
MKIAHVALWTRNLDAQAAFWQTFFGGTANAKYQSRNNPGFESYFITLDEGPTIELMTLPALTDAPDNKTITGWAHVALNVGSKASVDALADRARQQGILKSPPRVTGDGYYEAVLTDPDGNLIEIVGE